MKKVGKIILGVTIIGVIFIGILFAYTQNKHQKEANEKIANLENKIASIENPEQNVNNANNENIMENKKSENSSYQKDELSKEELENFEKFFNNLSVNGFVVQLYNNPEEINLNDVFYNYSSTEGSFQPTDEIENEFLKRINSEDGSNIKELPCPIEAVPTSEIQKRFKQYTGISLSNQDIKNRLNWTYLEDQDVYCMMHGDTNADTIACINGTKDSNGIYKITIKFHAGFYLGTNEEVESTIVTLKKNGDSYYFVSSVLNK